MSACTLAVEVRRRKTDVLETLRSGRFVQIGKGRSSRWDVVSPVRSFDTGEAATHWDCDLEMAAEFIFGAEGFLERGYVSSLNGNGRVVVTEAGLELAYVVGFLDEVAA